MIRKSLVIVFVLCLVTSGFAGPAAAGLNAESAAQSGPPGGMVGIAGENIQDLRSTAAQDASNVSAGDLEGAVYTSKHADSLEVSIVTADQASAVAAGASPSEAAQEAVCSSPAGGQNPQFDCEAPESYGLVLTDDEHTAGREVAIRAGVVEESLGYVPSKLTIQNNETGETWTSSASVEDGWLTASVEHFSSNAVTWSGEVDISMTGATNGSTTTYQVSDADSVSEFNATLTGYTNTEWDNVTKTDVADGGTVLVDVAGNVDPAGPSANGEPTVQIDGNAPEIELAYINGQYLYYRSDSGQVVNTSVQANYAGGVRDIDGDGDLDIAIVDTSDTAAFVDAAGNKVSTGATVQSPENYGLGGVGDVDGDGDLDIAYRNSNNEVAYVDAAGNTVSTGASASDYQGGGVGGIGDVDGDGSLEIAHVDGNNNVKYVDAGGNVTDTGKQGGIPGAVVDFDSDGDVEIAYTDDQSTTTFVDDAGETQTYEIDGDGGIGTTGDYDNDGRLELPTLTSYEYVKLLDENGTVSNTTVAVTALGGMGNIDNDGTRDPSIDVDDDGTAEVSISGGFAGTATRELGELTNETDSITVHTSRGKVDISVSLKERTQTDAGTLRLNGNETDPTGMLADGEQAAVTPPTDWIQGGQNNVTVVLPSTTADAPNMQSSLQYSHTEKHSQSVVYNDTTWTESYNISKTYGGERQEASLTVPFEGTVVDIHSLEYAVNGSSWSTVSESAYSLDQTTLTVDLRSVYGSDIPANTTFDVRTDGRKVQVSGGDITVLEPTGITDSRLDTRIEVHDSPSDTPLNIQTGDTRFGSRIHYAYNQSWADPAEYTTITSSEQTLVLPNAETTDTAHISTIPVTVTPETSGGDVEVVVDDAQTTEPVFEVQPGSSTGDEITYTYVTAQDDTDYVLYSETDGVILDSGTASSPLSLTGRDDAGVIQFLIDDTDTSSSGSDNTGVLGPLQDAPSPAETVLNFDFSNIWLVVLAAGGLGLLAVVYYRDGEDAIADAGRGTASGTRRAATWVATSIRDAAVWTASGLTSTVTWFASHPYITAGVAAVASIAAVVTGIITLPEGAGVFILVTATPAVAYVVLVRRLGVSQLVWAAITGVAVILGFQLLGTDVFGVLAASQAFPILAAGGVYLAYQALQTYRADASTPEEKNVIEFNADDGDNGGGGS